MTDKQTRDELQIKKEGMISLLTSFTDKGVIYGLLWGLETNLMYINKLQSYKIDVTSLSEADEFLSQTKKEINGHLLKRGLVLLSVAVVLFVVVKAMR